MAPKEMGGNKSSKGDKTAHETTMGKTSLTITDRNGTLAKTNHRRGKIRMNMRSDVGPLKTNGMREVGNNMGTTNNGKTQTCPTGIGLMLVVKVPPGSAPQ